MLLFGFLFGIKIMGFAHIHKLFEKSLIKNFIKRQIHNLSKLVVNKISLTHCVVNAILDKSYVNKIM